MKFLSNKIILSLLGLFLLNSSAFSQDATPYQFYNQKGKKVSFKNMVKNLKNYDIILFGENHDNSINHWLQLRLAQSLFKEKGGNLVLGAEMFERDNQKQLNAFLADEIEFKNLKDSMRLWTNHFTDYQPLIDFAKNNNLKFIATNIPRKYASQVYRQGLESLHSLSEKEKSWIMKLPVEVSMQTPGYSEMLEIMTGHSQEMNTNFVAAQAVKDATMAESIIQNLLDNQLFLHFNGNYHSKEYGGIYWYLKKINPKLKIAVISVFETPNSVNKWKENEILTEYNLIIPSDMTKTY